MPIRSPFSPMDDGIEEPFEPDFVLLNTQKAGKYPFSLKTGGIFDITLVGQGGGGYGDYYSARAGSSGAAFEGEVYLKKGDYTVTVGEATEEDGTPTVLAINDIELIIAGGGAKRSGNGGVLTVKDDPNFDVVLSRVEKDGNKGSGWTGGASVSTTGWGKGGPGVSSYGGGSSKGEPGGVIIKYKRLK